MSESVGLREFFEFRFGNLDEKIGLLGEAMERLTGAIVTREFFDELANDVNNNSDEIKRVAEESRKEGERLRQRISELETKARILQVLLAAAWLVLGPLLVQKLQELFN